MSSTSAEHSYFQAIEQSFIRLRGAPFMLSAKDWQTARGWFDEGIPLSLVHEVLIETFRARAERGAAGKIQSLSYIGDAIEEAWSRRRELGVLAPSGGTGDPVDVAGRLERLAQALPSSVPDRQVWAERVRSVVGTAEEIESRLAVVDQQLLEAVRSGMPSERLASYRQEVEEALDRLQTRSTRAQRLVDLERLLMDRIRSEEKLPFLSLFALEAVGRE